jgi:hypothetical protein
MDAAQKNAAHDFKVIESAMTENPFLAGNVPVRIEVPLRVLPQWQAAWQPVMDPPPANIKMAPRNPASLPGVAEAQPAGESKPMQLVPYGSTYLRLTTLPVIKT